MLLVGCRFMKVVLLSRYLKSDEYLNLQGDMCDVDTPGVALGVIVDEIVDNTSTRKEQTQDKHSC